MNGIASIRSMLILSVSALALAACAGKTPPPAIAYDSGSFHQAVVEPEPPKQVEIVAIPTPLPLPGQLQQPPSERSEEHTSELQSLMRISYDVFCLTKKTTHLSYQIKQK